ncbi:hypothetical protein PG984_013657 [Apiospora sp. TS-2023a]
MCQEVKEHFYCGNCNADMGQKREVHRCSKARRRGRDGDCDRGVEAHRGSPDIKEHEWCQPCHDAAEQEFDDMEMEDDYRTGGGYSW